MNTSMIMKILMTVLLSATQVDCHYYKRPAAQMRKPRNFISPTMHTHSDNKKFSNMWWAAIAFKIVCACVIFAVCMPKIASKAVNKVKGVVRQKTADMYEAVSNTDDESLSLPRVSQDRDSMLDEVSSQKSSESVVTKVFRKSFTAMGKARDMVRKSTIESSSFLPRSSQDISDRMELPTHQSVDVEVVANKQDAGSWFSHASTMASEVNDYPGANCDVAYV